MKIYCCGCGQDVDARLTNGLEIYPHRNDLGDIPFWKCDRCLNYVGTHHKTANRNYPLGNIPTPELRNARQHIHRILDPHWKSGRIKRKECYARISKAVGYEYHTAQLKTVEEARAIYTLVKTLFPT